MSAFGYMKTEWDSDRHEYRLGATEEGELTLHDYFAAHAPGLPAPIRDAFVKSLKRGAEIDLNDYAAVCARWSILYADAVMKARTE